MRASGEAPQPRVPIGHVVLGAGADVERAIEILNEQRLKIKLAAKHRLAQLAPQSQRRVEGTLLSIRGLRACDPLRNHVVPCRPALVQIQPSIALVTGEQFVAAFAASAPPSHAARPASKRNRAARWTARRWARLRARSAGAGHRRSRPVRRQPRDGRVPIAPATCRA